MSIRRYSLLAAILLSQALLSADPAPPRPADVPDWANGVLVVRNFGKTVDKVGAYSNQVLANLGELAKQYTLNLLFKQIPVSAGVKADGTAYIYPLDSILTGHTEESCFVLPTDDPDAMKKRLIEVLGAPAEDSGVLTFSIPQPLPQPDKTLVAKFLKDRLMVAPDAELLKKLDEFVAKSTPEAMAGTAPGDVVLTIKIDRFKRSFGKLLEGSMEMGAVMAANDDPKQADKLVAQMKSYVNFLWQVDVMEVRLSIAPKAEGDKELATTLELNWVPQPNTELDKLLHQPVPTLKGTLARVLPPETPFAMQYSLQGDEAATALKSMLVDAQMNVPDSRAAKLLLGEMLPALFKIVELGYGDGAFALLPKTEGITGLLALELKDTAAAGAAPAAFETFVKKTTVTADAAIKEDIAAAGGVTDDKPLLKLEHIAPDPGLKTSTWKFDMDELGDLEKKDLDRTIGWPLTMSETVQETLLLMAIGKKSGESLASASAAKAPAGPKPVPRGTCFQMSINPISLARTLLQVAELPDAAEGERMVAGLRDGTLTMQFRMGEGTASLRWEIPSSVPAGLIPLGQRMLLSGLSPRDLLGGQKGGAVPAPPPPGK